MKRIFTILQYAHDRVYAYFQSPRLFSDQCILGLCVLKADGAVDGGQCTFRCCEVLHLNKQILKPNIWSC